MIDRDTGRDDNGDGWKGRGNKIPRKVEVDDLTLLRINNLRHRGRTKKLCKFSRFIATVPT
jgi:hypothetical protein